MFEKGDYEDEILDKLVSFFDKKGEVVNEKTLLQLAEYISDCLEDND